MSMSPPPLQTQINALAARLAVLDGQGLQSPAVGAVAQTNADVAGLKTDLQQAVLTTEGLINGIAASLAGLWTALSTYLGLTAQPGQAQPTMIPPPGP